MDEEYLKSLTSILKKKLMFMMVEKWNGKDFTSLTELSTMADDVIKVIAEVGKEETNN